MIWIFKKIKATCFIQAFYSTHFLLIAPASLSHPDIILKVGLQNSRLQQTRHLQCLKISFTSDVFSSLGTNGNQKWPEQVNRQGVSALQNADQPTSAVCQEVVSCRNNTPFDNFLRCLKTSACFTLSKTDEFAVNVILFLRW
jgi:hypothetical protein